jgi:hypothetical protein
MHSAVLREVNERIYEVARQHSFGGTTEFLCECGQQSCNVTHVEMHLTEFADCITRDGCFVVAPRHERPDDEIVRAGNGYLLVRAATAEP